MDINSFVIGFKKGKASGGGGVELNIAYGDTAPEDTTKLWVKTTQPSGVVVSDVFETEETSGSSLVATASAHTTDHSACAKGAIDGKIYLLGGAYAPGTSSAKTTTEIVCYDPETEAFTVLSAVMPLAFQYMGSATVGSKIYTFGGASSGQGTSTYKKVIYCFDAETQTVTTLSATLPQTSNSVRSAAVGTNILVLQAYKSTANNLIYCFDTLTDTLTTLPFVMPGTVSGGSLVSDGKFAYFVGGSISSVYFYGVLRIDMESQTVTNLGVDLNTTPTERAAEYLGGKICIWGKLPTESTYTIETVDIKTGTVEWTKISDMIGTNYQFYNSAIITCGDAIYLFNGYKGSNQTTANTIENVYKFKASAEKVLLNKDTIQLKPTLDKNKFSLIGSNSLKIEIGIASAFKGNENNEAELVEAALYKDGAWTTI